jgi:hypothetical protein
MIGYFESLLAFWRDDDPLHAVARHRSKFTRIGRRCWIIASQIELATNTSDASLQEPSILVTGITNNNDVTNAYFSPVSQRGQALSGHVAGHHGVALHDDASNKEPQESRHDVNATGAA